MFFLGGSRRGAFSSIVLVFFCSLFEDVVGVVVLVLRALWGVYAACVFFAILVCMFLIFSGGLFWVSPSRSTI